MKAVLCINLILIVNACTSSLLAQDQPIIYIKTSIADVIDKIVILRIKQERINDPEKLHNITIELERLSTAFETIVEPSQDLDELSCRLLEVNKNLWDLEDAVRLKERQKCFDHEFVTMVNAILTNNDERACIKRSLNLLSGSQIIEEKSYAHIKESRTIARKPSIDESINLIIPLSLGELVDRITILLIKKDRITEPEKLIHVIDEYEILYDTIEKALTSSREFDSLVNELRDANEAMWDIQDALRAKKLAGQFDEEFIALGRSVYYTNDKRCTIKRTINTMFGSELIEEKNYTAY